MRYYETSTTERIGYDFYCDLANRIVEAREKKGWTQEQLSKASGLSLAKISSMELVKFRFVLPDLKTLSKALSVSVDWLIEAEIDSQIGECLYLVWSEKVPNFQIYQKSTSKRLAFLEWYDSLKKAGIRPLDCRERAIVKLVGIPVTQKELERRYPTGDPKEEDSIRPNDN
jgi:transcriptional regulator with XRE-family HTH domain